MKVRVRYAPSPTGKQHIGGLRTALFNYLFAKSLGGSFILRLEDTDRTRSRDEYTQNLYDTFKWLGFYWDEGPDVAGEFGPYIQSQRFELYKKYAHDLVARGEAYHCFCGEERLSALRKSQEASNSSEMGYDRHCRALSAEQVTQRLAAGEPSVIRLKIPLGGKTQFTDLLLGNIEWENNALSPDPVLLKSDGFPTYHLANIVDDHSMEITHVMRAQEWLSSTPMHVILYKAFGWTPPQFCHLPMVLGADGQKLSKRHGATSVDEFRTGGYLPKALINYVAHLGCSYKEGQEIFTLAELATLFKIEHLNKAGAVFDYTKLDWYNGQYLRAQSDAELFTQLKPLLVEAGYLHSVADEERAKKSVYFIKERITRLTDAPAIMRYLFATPNYPAIPAADFIPKKLDAARTKELLFECITLLKLCNLSDHADCEGKFRARAEELGVKLGDLLMPLRLAITGAKVSPPLFDSIAVLGLETALERINKAIAVL